MRLSKARFQRERGEAIQSIGGVLSAGHLAFILHSLAIPEGNYASIISIGIVPSDQV